MRRQIQGWVAALAMFGLAGCAAPGTVEPEPIGATAIESETLDLSETGLVGVYYAPPAPNGAGILVLGGSEGGLSGGQARVAQALAAEGYAVLHLAYFRADGLPPELREIPLEYFHQALAWLRARPGVDPQRIGLVGVSKGAEAVLLMATRDARVRAVVAGAPSSQVWIAVESCGVDTASSWTEGGAPVPALNCGLGDDVTDALSAYSSALATADAHPETAIMIETAPAQVLLVCGEADSLSPACPMARRLQSRARPDQLTLLAFADAGHAGFGVPVEPTDPNYPRLAALGGTPDGNGRARSESWPAILAFLREAL